MDFLLHAGYEHPGTLLIAVSAVLSLGSGVGVGAYGTDRDHATDEAAPDES